MKKLLTNLFFLVFIIILAQNMGSLATADIQDPQDSPPSDYRAPIIVPLNIFAKPNQMKYTVDEVCNLGICIRTPTPVALARVVPTRCRTTPDYCVLVTVLNLNYDVTKYLLEPESLLPSKAFQGKSLKIKSTITLILKGIEPSILKELSSGVVEVSKVMTIKGELHSVYIFLTRSK